MSKYIVCKEMPDSSLRAGTPPMIHMDFEIAKAEAERLASTNPDAKSYVIFKAFAKSERETSPVRTVFLA